MLPIPLCWIRSFFNNITVRFYPLIILSHIFHFFRAKNCTQNNIFPLCFSLQSHFTASNPLGKLKYCTQKSIYDKITARPLKLRSGCFMQKTTPLHFCTGVVLQNDRVYSGKSFRPLQFCTGVVLSESVWILRRCFRPLHFCTGVVHMWWLLSWYIVLDPCNFARVQFIIMNHMF